MTPARRDTLPEMAKEPAGCDSATVLEHPFVCRLLELGLPRLCPDGPPTSPDRPAVRRLETLAPASRTALSDINPPPLPQVFLTLRRTVEDPMSGVADVARVITMDPSLVGYVLRLANSALYNRANKVDSVERAVACIGLAEIQTMAIGAMLGKVFKEPPDSELLRPRDFWRHGVSVALLSRALAARIGARGVERFFVAGLLHDMGRLLLAIAEPDLAAMALSRALASGLSLDVAEQSLLGFDHAALGGRVCRKWQLPDSLGEAVAFHHAPAQVPDNTLAAVVHTADFLANALGLRAKPAAALAALDVSVLTGLGLTEADPPLLLDVLESGLEATTALFFS